MEKVEVHSSLFPLVFTGCQASHLSQVPEPLGRGRRSQIPPTLSKEQVWDYMMRLNVYRSVEPDGLYSRVLKELPDVADKPLSIVLEKSWLPGEVTGKRES